MDHLRLSWAVASCGLLALCAGLFGCGRQSPASFLGTVQECEVRADAACLGPLIDIEGKMARLFPEAVKVEDPAGKACVRKLLLDLYVQSGLRLRQKYFGGSSLRGELEGPEQRGELQVMKERSGLFAFVYSLKGADGFWLVADRVVELNGEELAPELASSAFRNSFLRSNGREPGLLDICGGLAGFLENRRVRTFRLPDGKPAKGAVN